MRSAFVTTLLCFAVSMTATHGDDSHMKKFAIDLRQHQGLATADNAVIIDEGPDIYWFLRDKSRPGTITYRFDAPFEIKDVLLDHVGTMVWNRNNPDRNQDDNAKAILSVSKDGENWIDIHRNTSEGGVLNTPEMIKQACGGRSFYLRATLSVSPNAPFMPSQFLRNHYRAGTLASVTLVGADAAGEGSAGNAINDSAQPAAEWSANNASALAKSQPAPGTTETTPDLRGVRWGWTVEQVIGVEKSKATPRKLSDRVSALNTNDEVEGHACDVTYTFLDNKLLKVRYEFPSKKLSVAMELEDILKNKYGPSILAIEHLKMRENLGHVRTTPEQDLIANKFLGSDSRYFITPRMDVEFSRPNDRIAIEYTPNSPEGLRALKEMQRVLNNGDKPKGNSAGKL